MVLLDTYFSSLKYLDSSIVVLVWSPTIACSLLLISVYSSLALNVSGLSIVIAVSNKCLPESVDT
ncbi:ORF216 [Staphylococcus phage G1]|uniref:ORF216 n=1 Tax=Staphylococcus phage G1 TaxID=2908166 RepID=Q4Z9S1_9CAUD|nr:ORF216 [Staphylococcus phage G1]AAX92261.1 ORF216 [Staphylococcus phage G1]